MAASQYLITALVHQLNASLLSAYRFKGRFNRRWSSLDLGETESALAGLFVLLEFLACFASVIRLILALGTEILLALRASDSEFAHVYSSILGDELASFILDIVVYVSRDDLHYVAAATVDEILVLRKKL